MIWTICARLRGRWSRRHWRRVAPPIPPSPDDVRLARLKQLYATRQIPPGHNEPIELALLQRLIIDVRAEHEDVPRGS